MVRVAVISTCGWSQPSTERHPKEPLSLMVPPGAKSKCSVVVNCGVCHHGSAANAARPRNPNPRMSFIVLFSSVCQECVGFLNHGPIAPRQLVDLVLVAQLQRLPWNQVATHTERH